MTYTMTPKRKQVDFMQTNWELHLEVFRLRNQGWKYEQIGRKLGLTRQRIFAMYKKMARLTVEEAEKIQKYVANLGIDNN